MGVLPIVKVKPDTVTITSYYCKLFVSRNTNSVANYSKYINRVVTDIGNNPEDNRISHVMYGVTKAFTDKLPRAYTAVASTIFFSFILSFFIKLRTIIITEETKHKTDNTIIKILAMLEVE